jgi:O-antigen ligase
VSYLVAPVAFSRISEAGHTAASQPSQENLTPEDKADRIALWTTALEIIKKNFLIGVGTGDVKDNLLDTYRKNGIFYAFDHKLNAHNQYLQTSIALGLAGFLVLVAILLFPALRALQRHQDIYLVFLFIFSIAILSESMLEIQAGVVFYAFFNVFLFTADKNGDPVS